MKAVYFGAARALVTIHKVRSSLYCNLHPFPVSMVKVVASIIRRISLKVICSDRHEAA